MLNINLIYQKYTKLTPSESLKCILKSVLYYIKNTILHTWHNNVNYVC